MKTVTILGSGVMGHGIAQLYAQHGTRVNLYDLKQEFLDKAQEMMKNSLSVMVEKEIIPQSEMDSALSNIHYYTNLEEALKGAEMAVEVIPEVLQMKLDLYREIEKHVSPDTIIASNTSAIPLTDLRQGAKHPERFLITHFFAPAQLIPLVEIIQNDGVTRQDLVQKTFDFMKKCGKSPIIPKKEVPGFIANRLQMALMREAFHLVESDIATPSDIDTVLKDSLGFRYVFLGPLEGQDIAGIGTTYFVSENLFPHLSDMKKAPTFLKEMIDNNTVGLRSNKGFYEYKGDDAKKTLARRDDNFLEVYKLRMKQAKKQKAEG